MTLRASRLLLALETVKRKQKTQTAFILNTVVEHRLHRTKKCLKVKQGWELGMFECSERTYVKKFLANS